MINLSTPSEQLLKELAEDLKKVQYWVMKSHGDVNGYRWRKQCNEYRRRYEREHQPFVGKIQEYKSKNGNRWFAWDQIMHYPGEWDIRVGIDAFVYWETYESIGCFHPTWKMEDEETARESCVIFTPHFFQRYCERRKIPFKSRELVKEVISELAYLKFQPDTDKDGEPIQVYRFPMAGFFIGRQRKDGTAIYEIRTYLDESNLSEAKKHRYQEMTNIVDDPAWRNFTFAHAAAVSESISYNEIQVTK